MMRIVRGVADEMISFLAAAALVLAPASAAVSGHGRGDLPKAGSSQTVRSNACSKVAARALLGSWTMKKGEGQFEDMVFEAEPRDAPEFRSYLHMRPDFWGSWSLKTCRVTIVGKTAGEKTITFTILSLTSREMRVLFDNYTKPGTYKRI